MKKYKYLDDVEDRTRNFQLIPAEFDKSKYQQRIDRNIGFITPSEQEALSFATVGIAGCGGMGGLLAATLLRAGIGTMKIADPETFEASNINRQFAARTNSIGLSKAMETAKQLREIASDTSIHVYPEGIGEATVKDFVSGCDVIADELEFWAVGARLLLHEHLPRRAVILNGNSVGMGTRLFRFTSQSEWKMHHLLGMDLTTGKLLQDRIQAGNATDAEIKQVQEAVLLGLVPDLPEYMMDTGLFSTRASVQKRLREEGRAPILATNPPMATGFLANHVILEILRKRSPLRRKVQYAPDMPGYLYFDAALMRAEVRQTIWWTRKEP
jgi:molybdopterin/thiamine biosynthesis adenylyltransferase